MEERNVPRVRAIFLPSITVRCLPNNSAAMALIYARYFATTTRTTTSEFLIKGLSFVAKQRDSEPSESFFGNVFGLLKQTFQEWLQDKAPQLGAALAYYTVFSLAPLVLVLLAIVGVLFRDDPGGAWNKITQQMSYFLDPSAVQRRAKHCATSLAAW